MEPSQASSCCADHPGGAEPSHRCVALPVSLSSGGTLSVCRAALCGPASSVSRRSGSAGGVPQAGMTLCVPQPHLRTYRLGRGEGQRQCWSLSSLWGGLWFCPSFCAAVWTLSNFLPLWLPPEPHVPWDVHAACLHTHPPQALAVMLTLGNKEPGALRQSVLRHGQHGKRNIQQEPVLRSRNR